MLCSAPGVLSAERCELLGADTDIVHVQHVDALSQRRAGHQR